ncbi:cob(I)yrinic acid a,c-diamide adenosyltransferase [Bacillus solimangrovi]|uniref:Corrinoid adenosyltransferase n=1 Tax=Bacillus solimangrovi TaxID=1305675 RepID=A0A1E5LHF5_9BACI|nr:cob(I)yrinic acid a,c-diamide adenosyltransferase [Bacillus solimangrovi]OEH93514.1 ATP:cob(I)alamin adenosyltransferase [Bacillus solimangrovi]
MKLYTRTGDKGKTSLVGGRVDKDHIRVNAYGTIDELNSFIGQAMTQLQDERFTDIYQELEKIQHELFDGGSDLARVKIDPSNFKLKEDTVTYLEERIDDYIEEAPKLERFILPGGSPAAATIHIARTVARRAERTIVTLQREETINDNVLTYVNRLSDYLFAIARVINARLNVKDVEYERSALVFRRGKRKDKE